ncbi:hypothetical protein J2751_001663 [Halorubrum alkaliphilum]|uniref:Uncharacterized protein n=1 Tax=Halorubrum alkaliphilum TaxID=261290 RepID=A0A8T4GG80_9EURY|nr:hypothetical protein [Halorubrum alkaliphilum]MBP1922650.1 hypothetical protein [Halorubrum alkaliphilum]
MSVDPSAASTHGGNDGRDAAHKRVLRAVAAQAAVLSAAVHLLWAWPQLAEPADPRPYVFVLGAVFTVLVAAATLKADEYRRLYALGAGTLSAYLLGYVGWHGGEVAAALVGDPLAIVGKGAELVGVVAFLALYRLAPPTNVVVERRNSGGADGSDPRPVDDGGERED